MSAYKNNSFKYDKEDLIEISEILEIINLRPRTIDSYLASLSELSAWLESNHHIPLKKVTLELVRKFILFLKLPVDKGGRGLKPRSVNIYIASIRKYFQTVLRIPLSSKELPSMKVDNPLPKVPSKKEVVKLIKGTKNLKHRTMLALAYGCALRLSEVISLRFGDISFTYKTLTVRAENSKNREEENVELPDNMIPLLKKYYYECCAASHPGPEDWLFPGQKKGTHISKGNPDKVLRKRLAALGWSSKGYSFHSLRHAHALHYYLAGADIYQVQLRLRHKNIASTNIYVRLAGKLQERRNIANPYDDPDFKM